MAESRGTKLGTYPLNHVSVLLNLLTRSKKKCPEKSTCNMSELNVPSNNTECIKRYPELQELYLTPVVLSWSKANWSLLPDTSKMRIPIVSTLIDPNKLLKHYKDTDNAIWVDKFDRDQEVVSDVVIHRGECRHFLHYHKEDIIKDISVDRELVIRAFCIEKLRKFSGIVSIRTVDKSVYTVSLKPNSYMLEHYSTEMHKSYMKYYKVKS